MIKSRLIDIFIREVETSYIGDVRQGENSQFKITDGIASINPTQDEEEVRVVQEAHDLRFDEMLVNTGSIEIELNKEHSRNIKQGSQGYVNIISKIDYDYNLYKDNQNTIYIIDKKSSNEVGRLRQGKDSVFTIEYRSYYSNNNYKGIPLIKQVINDGIGIIKHRIAVIQCTPRLDYKIPSFLNKDS